MPTATAELLTVPEKLWACPSCSLTERVRQPGVYTRMHSCAALGDLTAPMVEVPNTDTKVDARHVILAREDYVGQSGMSSIMAVRLDHGDGHNDQVVFAPTATGSLRADAPGGINRYQGAGLPLCVNAGTTNTMVSSRSRLPRRPAADPVIESMMRASEIADNPTMAWSTSKVFAFAALQALKATVNLNSDSYKVALYGNTGTPDNTVSTAVLTEYNGAASQWVVANECGNSGTYAAGGSAVAPISLTQTTNVVTFTSSGSPSWTGATLTAYGCLVYDTTVSNEGLCFNYFGGAQSVTAGTFSIAWNGSGIATFTC
jgi:hypothetical protein